MRSLKVCTLLAATALVLSACNSGGGANNNSNTNNIQVAAKSSFNQAVTESGIAALSMSPYYAIYSDRPSTGIFNKYISGSGVNGGFPYASIAAGNNNAAAIDQIGNLYLSNTSLGQWQQITLATPSIVTANSKVIANGSSYVVYNSTTPQNTLVVSTDSGKTWTSTIPSGFVGGQGTVCAYLGNQFVLFDGSNGNIFTSTNGATWQQQTVTGTSAIINPSYVTQIILVSGEYVFVTQFGNQPEISGSHLFMTPSLEQAPQAVKYLAGGAELPTQNYPAQLIANGNDLVEMGVNNIGSVSIASYNVSESGFTAINAPITTSLQGAMSVNQLDYINGNLYANIVTNSQYMTGPIYQINLDSGNITLAQNSPTAITTFANYNGNLITNQALNGHYSNNNLQLYTLGEPNQVVINLPSGNIPIVGFASNGTNDFMVATDGTIVGNSNGSWNPLTTIPLQDNYNVTGLIYGNGTLIATTESGANGDHLASSQIWYSTDNGHSWESSNLPIVPEGAVAPSGLSFQNGVFVVCDGSSNNDNFNNDVYTSINGINNWVQQPKLPTDLAGIGTHTLYVFDGVAYALTLSDNSLSVNNNPFSGTWSAPTNNLPATLSGGFNFDGTNFAGFIPASNEIYSSNQITSSSWTSNKVNFNPVSVAGVSYTATQFADKLYYGNNLVWTGKVWAAVAMSQNSSAIYTSPSLTSNWSATESAVDTNSNEDLVNVIQY